MAGGEDAKGRKSWRALGRGRRMFRDGPSFLWDLGLEN